MGPDTRASLRRFLVTWRDGEEPPKIHDIGCLSFDGAFTFRYLATARTAPGFAPLPGFPSLDRLYGPSDELFPFFTARIMERSRSDFPSYVSALDLPLDADSLDILGRSGGVTRGDHLVLTEEPTIAIDGTTGCTFLARGLRFALRDAEERERVLAPLENGVRLATREEPGNDVSGRALQICSPDGVVLGWVPDALSDYVRRVGGEPSGGIVVQRRNSADQPPHARLLVRVDGRLPRGSVTLPALGARPNVLAGV